MEKNNNIFNSQTGPNNQEASRLYERKSSQPIRAPEKPPSTQHVVSPSKYSNTTINTAKNKLSLNSLSDLPNKILDSHVKNSNETNPWNKTFIQKQNTQYLIRLRNEKQQYRQYILSCGIKLLIPATLAFTVTNIPLFSCCLILGMGVGYWIYHSQQYSAILFSTAYIIHIFIYCCTNWEYITTNNRLSFFCLLWCAGGMIAAYMGNTMKRKFYE